MVGGALVVAPGSVVVGGVVVVVVVLARMRATKALASSSDENFCSVLHRGEVGGPELIGASAVRCSIGRVPPDAGRRARP